jgi:hypothetical protein
MFFDFLRQFDAADRHGRRLESFEPEHRLRFVALFAGDLAEITLFRYLEDRTRTRRDNLPAAFSLSTARCEAA